MIEKPERVVEDVLFLLNEKPVRVEVTTATLWGKVVVELIVHLRSGDCFAIMGLDEIADERELATVVRQSCLTDQRVVFDQYRRIYSYHFTSLSVVTYKEG